MVVSDFIPLSYIENMVDIKHLKKELNEEYVHVFYRGINIFVYSEWITGEQDSGWNYRFLARRPNRSVLASKTLSEEEKMYGNRENALAEAMNLAKVAVDKRKNESHDE